MVEPYYPQLKENNEVNPNTLPEKSNNCEAKAPYQIATRSKPQGLCSLSFYMIPDMDKEVFEEITKFLNTKSTTAKSNQENM